MVGDLIDARGAPRGDGGLRRGHPPRRRTRTSAIVAEEPADAEESNARGTLAVLEAARAAGVKRVVYGSTIWVYGESGDDLVDEEPPSACPDHLYTASKLAGEMYCTSYAELYDVDLHDPALRHPLRPARAARGGDPDLRLARRSPASR